MPTQGRGSWDEGVSRVTNHGKPAAAVPAFEDEAEYFPDPAADYVASGRPCYKVLSSLLVLHNAAGIKATGKQFQQFQYRDLVSDDAESGLAADGLSFSVSWQGRITQRMIVQGRNLKLIFQYLSCHRLPFLRAADRDFQDGASQEPIITSIEIEEIKEEED